VVVLAIVSSALIVAGAGTILQLNQAIEREQSNSDEPIAHSVSIACELPLAVGDDSELSRIIERFVGEYNVLFVAAYDAGGRLMAHATSDDASWAVYQRSQKSNAFRVAEHGVQLSSITSIDIDEDTMEAEGASFILESDTNARCHEVVGRVVVGLSNAPLLIVRRNYILLTVVVLLVSVGSSVPFVFRTVGRWCERLETLMATTMRITRGSLSEPIEDSSDDEIGRLAGTFERMRCAVQERQEELRRLNAVLQRQLVVSESAIRTKSEFLAAVSHELRTPLHGVIGGAGLLLDMDLTELQREFVNIIDDSGRRQLQLINDILDFSKMDAGKLRIDLHPCDMQQVVRESVIPLRPSIEEKGLELIMQFSANGLGQVIADSGRVRQVLTNILSNAVKFSHQGHVLLSLTSEEHGSSRARVRLTVADTGVGIAEGQIDRIFERFTQADGSTTRQFGGTGLGLAISKQLVELMGGSIGVESRVGEGSVFWVTLDLPLADPAPAQENVIADVLDAIQTTRLGKGCSSTRVLIVDDVTANQKVAVAALQRLGYRVDTAGSGIDAIAMARRFHYDLILMDIVMPEMDGFEATRIIRQTEPRGRHVPIVAITALISGKDRERCLAAGMDDYVSKPLTIKALQAATQRWTRPAAHSSDPGDPRESEPVQVST
jgi:signal transduction histidine kinase/ActR/RegA family two-component response regulator